MVVVVLCYIAAFKGINGSWMAASRKFVCKHCQGPPAIGAARKLDMGYGSEIDLDTCRTNRMLLLLYIAAFNVFCLKTLAEPCFCHNHLKWFKKQFKWQLASFYHQWFKPKQSYCMPSLVNNWMSDRSLSPTQPTTFSGIDNEYQWCLAAGE